jgi:hypothetical protein
VLRSLQPQPLFEGLNMKTQNPVTRNQLFAVVSTKRGSRPTVEAVTGREDGEDMLRDMAAEPERYDGRKGKLRPVRLQYI